MGFERRQDCPPSASALGASSRPSDHRRRLRSSGRRAAPVVTGPLMFGERQSGPLVASARADSPSAPGWRRLEAPRSAVGDFHVLERENGAIGISGALGVGAPSATNRLEDIGAAGCSRFIAIGYAGALQPDLKVGDMVLCDRAIRDEGVSHHYLEPGKYAQPDRALTAALGNQMDVAGMGTEPGPPGPSTRPTARPSKRSADIETRACSRSGWRQPPSLPYRHTAGSTSQPLSW